MNVFVTALLLKNEVSRVAAAVICSTTADPGSLCSGSDANRDRLDEHQGEHMRHRRAALEHQAASSLWQLRETVRYSLARFTRHSPGGQAVSTHCQNCLRANALSSKVSLPLLLLKTYLICSNSNTHSWLSNILELPNHRYQLSLDAVTHVTVQQGPPSFCNTDLPAAASLLAA